MTIAGDILINPRQVLFEKKKYFVFLFCYNVLTSRDNFVQLYSSRWISKSLQLKIFSMFGNPQQCIFRGIFCLALPLCGTNCWYHTDFHTDTT